MAGCQHRWGRYASVVAEKPADSLVSSRFRLKWKRPPIMTTSNPGDLRPMQPTWSCRPRFLVLAPCTLRDAQSVKDVRAGFGFFAPELERVDNVPANERVQNRSPIRSHATLR